MAGRLDRGDRSHSTRRRGPGADAADESLLISPEAVAEAWSRAQMRTSTTIIAEAFETKVPLQFLSHTHPQHELVWVRNGTMTALVAEHLLTVPEGFGIWLPAGQPHSGSVTAGAVLYDAFFGSDAAPAELDGPRVVAMTPVLEALLQHLTRSDLDEGQRIRAEAVVLDVLEPAPAQLVLALPTDRRIGVITDALRADPGDPRSLANWSDELGLSERTITRGFYATTGQSFAQWRQALRMHTALRLLTEGWDVQEIAVELGYRQPSTFIAVFRRVTGQTPGSYRSARAVGHRTLTTRA